MKLDKNTGLVLEGGGMRGVFTSGVLDAFMKYDVYFPYVVAVSAGACNGMSYMSRQPRRARISNIDYLARYQYIAFAIWLPRGASLIASFCMISFLISFCRSILIPILNMRIVLRWLPPIVLRGSRCI